MVLAPLFAAVALVVRVTMGPPILFRQTRAGLHGRPFELVKFRTMRNAEPGAGGTAAAEAARRLTRVGRLLRASSLDELPELWNVLRGDMSLVGPRPLLMHYLPLYSPEQARRHEVRPGLTGWAQVNGRNALSWEEKFALDLWYVDNRSLLVDVKILLLTVWRVLRPSGIGPEGAAIMPEFTGSPQRTQAHDDRGAA